LAADTKNSGPPLIFDRSAYRARRLRAADAPGDGFLAGEAGEALGLRIAAVNRSFEDGLDLGSRERSFERLAPLARHWVRAGPDLRARSGPPEVEASEEAVPFAAETFDLVTSALSLHAVNDLPGALIQIRQVLRPNGLFVGALFGGETLTELRQSFAEAELEILGGVSPRVSPFADVRDLGGLLQRAGFALPVSDLERTVVRYAEPVKLFTDLRMMGETNVLAERAKHPLRREVLEAALRSYRERYSDSDGRVRATFDIVYLTGWAPHESQQKPLRPGSAKTRLADALGTREIPAGEKPGDDNLG
jgi:SAM-dependent methyltransferase